MLAQLVRENKDVLLRKFGSPGVTKKKKEQVWESIRQELLDLGADLPNLKTLRDTEWNNLRRATLKRYVESQKHGTCLTEIDEIIMDSIGRDYFQVKNEESDSADGDYSKYLTVECDPMVVQRGDSDNEMRHYNGENEAVGGGQHHARASTSNEAAGEQQKNPTPLRGDQIVPPSRLRQMMLKRKRLEEEDFAEFEDYENGFDNHHMQFQQEELDYERLQLEKELLRHEIQLRKVQVLECKAKTSYYQAATKALLEKKSAPLNNLDPLQ